MSTITPVSWVAKPCSVQAATQCRGASEQSVTAGVGSTTGLALLAVLLLVLAAGAFLKALQPVLDVIKAVFAAAATFVLIAGAILVLFVALVRR